MKRSTSRQERQSEWIGWVQYVGMVLAFIGLWQLLSSGTTFLHHFF